MNSGHFWLRVFLCLLVFVVFVSAWIWSRKPEPQKAEKKPTQQFCKDEEDTGFYLPCEWVKHESEA